LFSAAVAPIAVANGDGAPSLCRHVGTFRSDPIVRKSGTLLA
jgi:hypothetical protein